MPRPVDEFMDPNDNISDHDIEDRKIKPTKSKKKKTSYTESAAYVEDTSFGEENPDLVDPGYGFSGSQADSTDKVNVSPKSSSAKKKKGSKTKDDDDECSSEEERWLHAIEAGKLEEVDDELKKIKPKDPKLMTARQRAMLERKSDIKDNFCEQLVSLPTGYREKVVTPQMLEEKAKKLQKRKQLADEKRENDKKKTMERLLKKSESKSFKISQKQKGQRKAVPVIVYTNRVNSITLSMPPDVEFPSSLTARDPRPTQVCGVAGCGNRKRYNCSKTGTPLCSFQCYKVNLQQFSSVQVK